MRSASSSEPARIWKLAVMRAVVAGHAAQDAVAGGDLDAQAPVPADGVLNGLGADEGGHGAQLPPPSSRSAAAASSAAISRRERRSRMARRSAARSASGASGASAVTTAASRSASALDFLALGQAQRAHEGVDAAADGGIGDAELALHLLQVAPRAQEALQQRQLLLAQPAEATDAELAFQGGAAAAAVEPRDEAARPRRRGRWR